MIGSFARKFNASYMKIAKSLSGPGPRHAWSAGRFVAHQSRDLYAARLSGHRTVQGRTSPIRRSAPSATSLILRGNSGSIIKLISHTLSLPATLRTHKINASLLSFPG